jgi:hypothetical protein
MAFGPSSTIADFLPPLVGVFENGDGTIRCAATGKEPEAVLPATGSIRAYSGTKGCHGSLQVAAFGGSNVGVGFLKMNGNDLSAEAVSISFQSEGVRVRRWNPLTQSLEHIDNILGLTFAVGDVLGFTCIGGILTPTVNGLSKKSLRHPAFHKAGRMAVRCAHGGTGIEVKNVTFGAY